MLARALELVDNLPEVQRARTEPQLLATLAAHRWAGWDVPAIGTYEILAARAAGYGLIDLQVRVLLDLSYFLSYSSAERCLEAAQRALRLSAAQNPAMRTRTRTACAFRLLSVGGWNAEDALEFRAGLAELGTRHGLTVLADLVEEGYIRWLYGEYREGWRLALEFRAEALKLRANPNLRIEHERASSVASLNLIFLGEWGEALKVFAAAMAQMQETADDARTPWLRVLQAWLYLHALDFKGAQAICQSALTLLRNPARRSAPAPPGQLHAALICSGLAYAALGDHARALEDLSAAASEMDHQKVVFDWYWRMPLAAGMTQLWLAKGDRVHARLEAERFLDLALATEEHTWQGLAWEANARVALTNWDHARARDCIAKGVSTIQGFEVPLAAWQVHATAAQIDEEAGNRESARLHRDLSRATILRLANSLPEHEPLRKTFLSAPAVARILG
jgi:tetratricopeptide (TPR) repeat protein